MVQELREILQEEFMLVEFAPATTTIDYITINTLGNSADFGDLVSALVVVEGEIVEVRLED